MYPRNRNRALQSLRIQVIELNKTKNWSTFPLLLWFLKIMMMMRWDEDDNNGEARPAGDTRRSVDGPRSDLGR